MKKTILKISCAVLLLAVGGGGALFAFSPLGRKLGGFDRKHDEAIVAQVRTMPLAAGKELQFRLDDPSDPASLRALKPGETIRAIPRPPPPAPPRPLPMPKVATWRTEAVSLTDHWLPRHPPPPGLCT